MKTNQSLQGHLLSLFCALVWGTTFVSSKVLLQDFSPEELLFNRFLLGYLALWLMSPKRLPFHSLREELLFASAGLSGVTLYYLFENLALTYTQAANVSVIVSTAPMFVSLLVWLFLKEEQLNAQFFVGFACAIVGIILLSFGGGTAVQMHLLGDSLCVAAAFLWGVYSVLIKKINALGYPVILTTRRIFLYGILFMIPLAVGSGYQIGLSRFQKPVNLLNLLFLGIIACAVCFVSWNHAVAILGAMKTSAYIYAIPVITLVASILVLQETITPMMAVGTALTIVGLVVSEKKQTSPDSSPKEVPNAL